MLCNLPGAKGSGSLRKALDPRPSPQMKPSDPGQAENPLRTPSMSAQPALQAGRRLGPAEAMAVSRHAHIGTCRDARFCHILCIFCTLFMYVHRLVCQHNSRNPKMHPEAVYDLISMNTEDLGRNSYGVASVPQASFIIAALAAAIGVVVPSNCSPSSSSSRSRSSSSSSSNSKSSRRRGTSRTSLLLGNQF